MNTLRRFKTLRGSQILALIFAMVAGLWIASGVVTGKAPRSKDQNQSSSTIDQGMRLVRVRSLAAQPFQKELKLYGRTEAVTYAELAAETSGRIVRRYVEKGAWIEKGAPLIQLAIEDREAHLSEAQALVRYQTIAYNAAKRLSQKQFQSRIRLAEAEADLAKAQTALASIKLDIKRTTIRAPISGYIETLVVNVGDYLKVGRVIGNLVSLHPISVVAQVSERNVTRLNLNDVALALLPDGRSLSGKIRYISKAGNLETRTFRVEVWIDNIAGTVSEGLTAVLKIPLGAQSAHRVSPAVLTLDDRGVIGVKAVDDGGRVIFYPSQILADTPEGIWLGSLPEKLTLISVGQEFVKFGQKVRIKDEFEAKAVALGVSD